jgi:hypothetical protein
VTAERMTSFFRIVFGEHEGYICVARREPGTRTFNEEFFLYPSQLDRMMRHVDYMVLAHDLYFCPQLLSKARRVKESVKVCPVVWADLDTCPPSKLLVPATIVAETSPNRFQGLWLKKPPFEPAVAEDISRRIAYYHAEDGADKSGWDLTQLLRIPYTYNHKYKGTGTIPQIRIVSTNDTPLELENFDVYPEAEGFEYTKIPFPTELPTTEPIEILDSHRAFIHPQVWTLFNETPSEDWSRSLWLLENYLFEGGVSREETFVIARVAACNKYDRDGKSEKLLWLEVCRAWSNVHNISNGTREGPREVELPHLLSDEERFLCEQNPTLVEEYVEWGKTIGDAAWQYHEAGAFIILSTLLGATVRLPTSFGTILPNLWFMILADTTLTRKTTAMDLAMDILIEIDSDAILATDGSIEGLMTSLSMRPGRSSIFLRDEFSGLLEAMTKKDYYAGMAETLTKLYDGKLQKRILRKEVIEVRDPVLILFAGGIKTRVLSLLTHEHIASGFLPRFIFVLAESDTKNLKPLGPPTDHSVEVRQKMIDRFKTIYGHYNRTETFTIGDKSVTAPKRWQVEMTPQAWTRFNVLEQGMLSSALKTEHRDTLTPTFDRLAKSGLKLAMLIAASRNLGTKVTVTVDDIVRAFYYVEKWRYHAFKVVTGVGTSPLERLVQRVMEAITRSPGVRRATLMQNFHLMSREADVVFGTLEQRGLISRVKSGRAETLYPVT